MKFLTTIFLILFSLWSFAQTFEMYKGDTINKTDAAGLKQGNWKVLNATKTLVLEEGKYVNNKKEGLWKKFNESGTLKQELTYLNNKADGYAKFYYDNGSISEEGLWKNNKWVGQYKYYYENGKLSYEWNYSEQGKRSGVQKYYHPNGKIMIEGEWNEGKESGVIKEYDDTGNLVSEKNFNDGALDDKTVKTYETQTITPQKNNEIKTETKVDTNTDKTVVEQKEQDKSLEVFNGTGYNKLYNKKGKVEQEGDFVKGILIKGKKFYYDEKGALTKTVIYVDGKVYNVIEANPKK